MPVVGEIGGRRSKEDKGSSDVASVHPRSFIYTVISIIWRELVAESDT